MNKSSSSSSFLVGLLNNLECSLIFSAYQSGYIFIISVKNDKLIQLTRKFSKPMGISLDNHQLALSTLDELIIFSNKNDLSKNYPNKRNTYDSIFIPRASYYTGILDLHDISFGINKDIYAVNTMFSCVCKIDDQYSFKTLWKPDFITDLLPEDRCHLNGMAMLDGKPRFVTALSATNTKKGWRDNIMSGGILIDVKTNKIILDNLAMPHSPRIIHDDLYLLESAKGQIIKVNKDKGSFEVVAKIPGILRGMTEYGNYIFIGVSKPRESSKTFSKLPKEVKQQHAGLVVIYKPTWTIVGEIKYPDIITEIYDIQILPNLIRPNIVNPHSVAARSTIVTEDFSFWKKNTNIVKNN